MIMPLINQFISMLDIVPVPVSPVSPRDITGFKTNPDTTLNPTSNISPLHRGVRKVRSAVNLRGSTPPARDPRPSLRSLPHQYDGSSVNDLSPNDSFTGLINTYSRSSDSTGTGAETLLTPAQSSHNLVSPDWAMEEVDVPSDITFTISEAQPLSGKDMETLARIRAAYPDPNQISIATASIVRRSNERPSSSVRPKEEGGQSSSYDRLSCDTECLPSEPVAEISRTTSSLSSSNTTDDSESEYGTPTELGSCLPDLGSKGRSSNELESDGMSRHGTVAW